MQAVDRVIISNNWMTLVFVVALVLLFVLKTTHQSKLIGFSKAFFVKGFIEKKAEEKETYFSLFNSFLFVFSAIVFSLLTLFVLNLVNTDYGFDFELFIRVLIGVISYLFLLDSITFLLSNLFHIRNEMGSLVIAKKTYLFNTAIWLFPFLIIAAYGFYNLFFILSVFVFLFGMSIVLIAFNNKNLILSKLFYFILYLCALEIAPLLIIYKIMV
jgi:hypothetical protein